MFRNTATAEAGQIERRDPTWDHDADLVPLSHLSLDLPALVTGWAAYLTGRGIEVVADDIGRDAISRDDVRLLITEQREAEARHAAKREAVEREAIAQDQARRAQIWQGVPADRLPIGVAPAAVMLQASRDAQPRRTTPLQEALQNSGELTFHSLQAAADEE
jgi:hypothetical protein